MPNIFHQSVEDILKTATPEQRLLWNYVFLRWGERVPIAQLSIFGGMGELNIYSANKIYVAYELEFSTEDTSYGTAAFISGNLCDTTNTIHLTYRNASAYWDATAAGYRAMINTVKTQNVWFSRLTTSAYNRVKFIGYRISI